MTCVRSLETEDCSSIFSRLSSDSAPLCCYMYRERERERERGREGGREGGRERENVNGLDKIGFRIINSSMYIYMYIHVYTYTGDTHVQCNPRARVFSRCGFMWISVL